MECFIIGLVDMWNQDLKYHGGSATLTLLPKEDTNA